MTVSQGTRREEAPAAGGACRAQPHCPVCNGPLIPLRGHFRCARCAYSLCVGCEGPEAPDAVARGD